MSETVQTKSANGYLSIALPENDLEQNFTYVAEEVATISVVYIGKTSANTTVNNVTYIQTFTRDGSGNVTNISQWVPQP